MRCTGSRLRGIAGLALAALWASPALAQATSASAGVAPPAPATVTWDLRVEDVDVDGASVAAAGVEVEFVALGQNSEGEVVYGEPTRRRSDAAGRVVPPPQLRPGAAIARYRDADGAPAVATLERASMRIGRYRRALADADLRADVRVNLEVGDSGLRTWVVLTLATDVDGARRWGEAAPLALPLVAPAVGDVVLDRGLFPDGGRGLRIKAQGDAAVTVAGGALNLVGSVAPGRPVQLRVRYPIATDADAVTLGLRGVVGRTELLVAALAVEPAAPRLQTAWPARIGTHREGSERLAGLSLLRPLRQGEVLTFVVADLPARPSRPGKLLASLFGMLCVLAGGAALRARRGTS